MKLLFERDLGERKKIWQAIKKDSAFRKRYFEFDFYSFAIFYFWENFKTWVKDFHKDIYNFLVNSKRNGVIIWFRESGKTAIVALFYVLWCIAYNKQEFILFMAYDLESAKDKVLNVSNFLRANKKFKNDYWLLFSEKSKSDTQEFNAQKTMSKFVSTTGVKIEAVSLKNMKRGKQFLNEQWEILRPDLLIADDIDIEESVKNLRIIDENETKILSGVLKSLRWRAIFLWNIITEDGIIQRLEKIFAQNWRIKKIALIENEKIVWPERYVWTEVEAEKINTEKFSWEKIVQSIEELSIDKQSFNSDFLNIPKIVVGDPVFDTQKLLKIPKLDPLQVFDLQIDDRLVKLEIYAPWYRTDYYDYLYAGIDTAGWQWGDSDSTSMTFLDKNWDLYAKINSNIINYKHTRKILTLLRRNYWFLFFKNSLCVERNLYGVPLIDEILEKDPQLAKYLYIAPTEGKKVTKYTNFFGWNTSKSSKEKLKTDLSTAINFWKIQLSKSEHREFLWWSQKVEGSKIVYAPDGITSSHDDMIIARGLALQMFLQKNPNYLQYE